jgi:hypothetical protein
MKKLSKAEHRKRAKDLSSEAWNEQRQWLPMWRELNEAFFPFLYRHLTSLRSGTTVKAPPARNTKMVDSVPADALFVLASGFMNGVTSPARKWLRVKRPSAKPYEEDDGGQSEVQHEIQTIMLDVLAGSNYYEARAVQVWDSAGLGTSAMLIYEDYDTVIKCLTLAPGSYALTTDNYNRVVKLSRKLYMRKKEIVDTWGEDSVGKLMRDQVKTGGPQSRDFVMVNHLIEANEQDGLSLSNAPFRELYWLEQDAQGQPEFLAVSPLYEWPLAVLRWHCPDDSTYGLPFTLGVYGKAIQIQNLELKSDQGLDKMITPPILADHSMRNRPKAFAAGGVTYTNNLSPNSGARALLQLQMPFQEMEIKRQRLEEALREGLFNPLFTMISQLDTVRTATEIDARREEKLVMLGPVLHRSYGEDLGMLAQRVHGICQRKGLLPPTDEPSAISFSNILSDVQKASDVSTIERFFGFVGNIVAAFPEVQQKVNAADLVKQYAEGLGIRPSSLVSDEDAAAAQEAQAQMQQMQQMAEIANKMAPAAQVASQTDPGAGLAAVQGMM